MFGMMEEQEVTSHRFHGLTFGMYSKKEIEDLAVLEITNPQTFDALLHPTYGGLYDPALGPSDRDDVCGTCGQTSAHCPGHMGYIKLPFPVYNPSLFRLLLQLLRATCFECNRLFLSSPAVKYSVISQFKALDCGDLALQDEIKDIYNEFTVDGGGDAGVADLIKEKMDECLRKATKGIDKAEALNRSRIKHVVECRQQLIKDFWNGEYFTKSKCPNCKKKPRPIRSEHNTKIFFNPGRSNEALKKQAEMKKLLQRRKRQREGEEDDDPEEIVADDEEDKENEKTENEKIGDTYITPTRAREHMRFVWKNDSEILQKVYGALGMVDPNADGCPTDIFFLEVLPVPPSRFRPISQMGDRAFENAQTANLAKVVADVVAMKEIIRDVRRKSMGEKDGMTEETIIQNLPDAGRQEKSDMEKLQGTWLRMQTHVNAVFDSDLDKISTDKNPGIKQLLEKKQGLFRKHMMGKRVNYSARSVISPDPYISTNEIGIPDIFAKKLTYPQPVTPWNFHELKQSVINGPKVHPGACFVVNEDGRVQMLSASDKTQREAIAKQLLTPSANALHTHKNKVVYRHLKNGDVLLLNRQPTLHRPSIQAHKARILPGEKTLRLHYANCKAYNADFDGDEMNAHFPQNELGRSEAYTIASTDNQYLVPKDGSPLAGLIQDHMVSGVNLTIRGRFFKREDYQQLVYTALTDKVGPVKLLKPAMIKPCRLWSGKQVLSTLVLNIIPEGKAPLNLTGKSKVSGKNWLNRQARSWLSGGMMFKGDEMSESEVVIRNGELLVGVLDKGHYGNTPYGMVHCCYELYGGKIAGKLLTCLAKLFTTFLQYRGFTLGVEDILCTKSADSKRKKVIRKSTQSGPEVAAKALNVKNNEDEKLLLQKLAEAHYSKDDGMMKDLDLSMKGKTDEIQNDVAKICMPAGLHKKFPHNNLQLMVQTGAKGSTVNCMQISCLLGQIELEGRRPPLMINGQSLPSFVEYDTAPRAGGFVAGRFLTGIRPQEYFFHCMAGREGLIDTAVKTSRSGYLQRCIIKHLEGLVINYDMTVRDSDGSIVQFKYGEDSMSIPKVQFLNKKQFPFLIHNKEAVLHGNQLEEIKEKLDTDAAPELWNSIDRWKKKYGKTNSKERQSGFLKFCGKKFSSVVEDFSPTEMTPKGRSLANAQLCQMWFDIEDDKKRKYSKKFKKRPDPPTDQLSPDRHFGSISEKMEEIIDSYMASNPDKLLHNDVDDSETPTGHIAADKFKDLLYLQCMKALGDAGEAVGLLAAQSIGEPSTQMTLNTFHFAGRGEMNVTLGIPRLREILMVASANIKTPTMEIPLHRTPEAHAKGKKLKKKFTRVYLSQVLEDVEVIERLEIKDRSNKGRLYTLVFRFLPHDYYKEDFSVNPSKILNFMEKKFLRHFHEVMSKKLGQISKNVLHTAKVRNRSRFEQADKDLGGVQDNEDEDIADDDLNDGDAAAEKSKERQQQERDYQGEEEEKDEIGEEESDSDLELEDGVKDEGEENESEDDSKEALSTSFREKKDKKKNRKSLDPMRINGVLASVSNCVRYEYDVENELWCEITYRVPLSSQKLDLTSLIEEVAKKTILYHTPGINRCFLNESKKPGEEGLIRLTTEGVNILEMYKYEDVLDVQSLYTNDIHAMANTYGIEAACTVLVKEIVNVFAAYGIGVDYRHLSLVSDYMTFEGKYKPFNRMGMESNPSPLQKMTFESTMHYLKAATIAGERDDLESPSSRLIVGKLVKGGTGLFELVHPLTNDRKM